MIIQATFIGENGSLGYKFGQKYNLAFLVLDGKPVVFDTNHSENGTYLCPYSSFDTLLDNWTDISKVIELGSRVP